MFIVVIRSYIQVYVVYLTDDDIKNIKYFENIHHQIKNKLKRTYIFLIYEYIFF